MEFTKEKYEDVIVEIVNLTRATLKEAEEFKKLLAQDIEEGNKKISCGFIRMRIYRFNFLGSTGCFLKKINCTWR